MRVACFLNWFELIDKVLEQLYAAVLRLVPALPYLQGPTATARQRKLKQSVHVLPNAKVLNQHASIVYLPSTLRQFYGQTANPFKAYVIINVLRRQIAFDLFQQNLYDSEFNLIGKSNGAFHHR